MEQIKRFAKSHTIPIMSDATWELVHYILTTTQPRACWEIGSAVGRGSIHIAQTIKQRGGYLWSCEISHPSYQLTLRHQWHHRITNFTCYHADMLCLPQQLIPRLDFIFVDGQKSMYADYLTYLAPHIHDNTMIICDDCIRFADKMPTLLATAQQLHLNTLLVPLRDGDGVYLMSRQPHALLADIVQNSNCASEF
jgi:predicted O-methyltransferase YrrM